MSNSNICEQCGGVIRLEYVITFERCTPIMMRHEPPSVPSPFKLCPGHPEPAPKHDGWLDKNHCHMVQYSTIMGEHEVSIGSECRDVFVGLSPQEALSLLAWLQQEKPILERLIEEVPGD